MASYLPPDTPYVRVQPDGCWLWARYRNEKGYARLIRRGHALAHRLFYELAKGPIPLGYQIDHLCRNKGCVNPEHLEAVTPRENMARGIHKGAEAYRTNTCWRGHKLPKYRPGRLRRCRPCMAIQKRIERARQRAA